MTPKEYASLADAIDECICEWDRNYPVHEKLIEQMADAARAVYDSCADGQKCAKEQS